MTYACDTSDHDQRHCLRLGSRRRPTRPVASVRTTSLAPASKGSNACGPPLSWIGVVPPECKMSPLLECPRGYGLATGTGTSRSWRPTRTADLLSRLLLRLARVSNRTSVSTWKAPKELARADAHSAARSGDTKTMAFPRREDRRSRDGSAVVCAWLTIMCRTNRPPAEPDPVAVKTVRR